MTNDTETVHEAWITKYLFTRGIFKVFNGEADNGVLTLNPGGRGIILYHRGEWHRSEAEAREQATKMIERKRKALARQMNDLDDLSRRMSDPMPLPNEPTSKKKKAKSSAENSLMGWAEIIKNS